METTAIFVGLASAAATVTSFYIKSVWDFKKSQSDVLKDEFKSVRDLLKDMRSVPILPSMGSAWSDEIDRSIIAAVAVYEPKSIQLNVYVQTFPSAQYQFHYVSSAVVIYFAALHNAIKLRRKHPELKPDILELAAAFNKTVDDRRSLNNAITDATNYLNYEQSSLIKEPWHLFNEWLRRKGDRVVGFLSLGEN